MPRMAKSMNISLPPQLYAFVEKQLAEGAYVSASAVIQDAVRLLQKEREIYDLKVARLREELGPAMTRFEAGERGTSLSEFKAHAKRRRDERAKRQQENGEDAP